LGRFPAKIQGGAGLYAAIFFCQNTGAKKGFPLQSLTQAQTVHSLISSTIILTFLKYLLFYDGSIGFIARALHLF